MYLWLGIKPNPNPKVGTYIRQMYLWLGIKLWSEQVINYLNVSACTTTPITTQGSLYRSSSCNPLDVSCSNYFLLRIRKRTQTLASGPFSWIQSQMVYRIAIKVWLYSGGVQLP